MQPTPPVFMFEGSLDGFWTFASVDALVGWVEEIDVEEGEYERVFDAAGRRVALRVEERRRPRGAARRALRLPPRKVTEIVWSLEEVSVDERERVAKLLAVGLAWILTRRGSRSRPPNTSTFGERFHVGRACTFCGPSMGTGGRPSGPHPADQ